MPNQKKHTYDIKSLRKQVIDTLVITEEDSKKGYFGIVADKSDITNDIIERFAICLTKWDGWARKITKEEAKEIENDEYSDDDVYYIGKEIWATSEGIMDLDHALDNSFDIDIGTYCTYYKEIIEKILENKEILPLLLRIDECLDNLISKKLSK